MQLTGQGLKSRTMERMGHELPIVRIPLKEGYTVVSKDIVIKVTSGKKRRENKEGAIAWGRPERLCLRDTSGHPVKP